MSTRGQHFFMPNSGSAYTQSLRESRLPGCELEWKVPEKTPKCLSLTTSSLWSFAPPLQIHAYLGHRSLLRCLGGCILRKEASVGNPSDRALDTWWLYPGPRGQRVSHHRRGALGSLFPASGNQTVQVYEESLWRAPCWAVLTPPQCSPGTLVYSESRDGIAVQVRRSEGI